MRFLTRARFQIRLLTPILTWLILLNLCVASPASTIFAAQETGASDTVANAEEVQPTTEAIQASAGISETAARPSNPSTHGLGSTSSGRSPVSSSSTFTRGRDSTTRERKLQPAGSGSLFRSL